MLGANAWSHTSIHRLLESLQDGISAAKRGGLRQGPSSASHPSSHCVAGHKPKKAVSEANSSNLSIGRQRQWEILFEWDHSQTSVTEGLSQKLFKPSGPPISEPFPSTFLHLSPTICPNLLPFNLRLATFDPIPQPPIFLPALSPFPYALLLATLAIIFATLYINFSFPAFIPSLA